jgi:DNA-binding MarR family transcriptional regulator
VKPIADEMVLDCMGGRLRMANRIVTAIYDEALSDLGLKGSQLNLLVAVFREGTIRQTDLATLFNIDETTLSRNVMRMCRKGWLAPQPSKDRRSHGITVTKRGRDMIERAYPAWKAAQTKVRRRLGTEVAAALKDTLRQLLV